MTKDPLYSGVENLGLETRATNALKKADIYTIKRLTCYTPEQLMKLPNFWKENLNQTVKALTKMGYALQKEKKYQLRRKNNDS